MRRGIGLEAVACALAVALLLATESGGALQQPQTPGFAPTPEESMRSSRSASLGEASDPATTTLRPLRLAPTVVYGGATGDGAGAEMAYDGSNFLLVWHDERAVFAALLSPEGVVVGPGQISVHTGRGWRPSVAFDGTNYMVFWVDGPHAADRSREILAVRVSTAGVVLDDEPLLIGVNSKQRRVSAAFDGTTYFVVWRTDSDEVRGGRVSTAGVPLDGTSGLSIGGGFYSAVKAAGGRFLVAWHGGGNGLDVYGALVDDGVVGAPFTIFSGDADQDHVSIATDGTDFMVGFRDGRFGNQQNFAGMSAVRVAGDGTVLDDPPIHISDAEWSQGTNPTVAWDGTDWIAAWPEDKSPYKFRLSDIYARRISTAGAIVNQEPIPLATGFAHQVEPTFGIAGNRYVLAYMDRGDPCFTAKCLSVRVFQRVVSDDSAPPAAGPPQAETGVWEPVGIPIDGAVHSVWAFDDDSAFAATEPDSSPLLQWDGNSWTAVASLHNARKFAIWGSSATRVFAGGWCGDIVFWNGLVPQQSNCQPFPKASSVGGIWGFGGTKMFAAASDGFAFRYFGTGWPDQPSHWKHDVVREDVNNWDVWGSAADNVYVAGEFGTLGRYDGTAWTLVDVPTEQSLNGIWGACSTEDMFAVGDFGTILHNDGTGWSRQGSPTTQHLFAVAGFGGSNVYAVGDGGTILHYDGTTWSKETSGTAKTLEDVGVGESTVWVTGAQGGRGFPGVGPGTILRKLLTIVDTTAPGNPVLSSSTHASGTWTTDPSLKIVIDGGCDDGRGIDGLSALFDHQPTTTPDTVKDLEAGTLEQSRDLADGEWYYHLRTGDRAGNWSAASHLGPFLIDRTPPTNPVLSSDPPAGAWSNAGGVEIAWRDAHDAGSGVAGYSFSFDSSPDTVPDAAAERDGGATGAHAFLADGTWYFHLRTGDGVENWSGATHLGPFRLDTVRPEAPTASSPSHTVDLPSNDNTVEIAFEGATDDASGIDGFSYDWTGSPDDEPDVGKELEETATGATSGPLADGDWWFHIRAVNNAANGSATARIGPFKIDTLAPETAIDSAPPGFSSDRAPTFEFSAGEPGSSFECSLDDAPFSACGSPMTLPELGDGPHTFAVRSVDGAANPDPSPATHTWTVDTIAPDTTIDAGPPSHANATSAEFAFSSDEPGSSFACSLDGAPYEPCAPTASYSGLGEGFHHFQVLATDRAGNSDPSPALRAWTVDVSAPETAVDSGPADPTNDRSPSFSFSANEGATFECNLDGGGFLPCTSPLDYGDLNDGSHTFRVRATDLAGNPDPTPAEWTWTVEAIAPETTIDSSPADPTNDRSPSFTFSASEAATFECSLDAGDLQPCASPLDYGDLGVGLHTFQVRATDSAGNVDATPAERAWTIDTGAPETTIDSGPADPGNDRSPSFTFAASEASTFECKLDGGGFLPCASPVGYGDLGDGSHSFQVRATDAAGNTDATPAGRVFTIDTAAPETTIGSGPPDLSRNRAPSFGFTSSEAGSTFECKLDGELFFTPCTSPRTLVGLADGSHTFQVRATDGARNSDPTPASRTFAVDTVAPETTIDSGPTGSSPTFAFSANEAGATFECKLDVGAFAPCSSPHTTATLVDGGHTFDVRATDRAGNTDPTAASRAFMVEKVVRRATVALASGTVVVTAAGIASVKLGCGSQAACSGVVTLEATVDERVLASWVVADKRRKIKLGSRAFSIGAGRTGTVRVKLSRRGFRAVKRLGRLRARAVIVTRQAGGGKRTASRTITLKGPTR